jgi:hypothetical protein
MSETTNQEPTVALKLADLFTVLEALQVANSRQAFNEEELVAVNGSYQRIHAVLVATGAIKVPEADSATTAPTEQQ